MHINSMDQIEIFTLLFTDTLTSNLVFNTSTELVLHSMKMFGIYNADLTILIASIAYMFACIVNYVLGMVSYKVLSPLSKEEATTNINIDKIRKNKFLSLLLMISAYPFFGKFIILFAGFCRIRLILVLAIGVSTKIAYYTLFTLF